MNARLKSDAAGMAVRLGGETDFDGWRDAARTLVLNGIAPDRVAWAVGEAVGDLLGNGAASLPVVPEGATLNVLCDFVNRAETVICHSDPRRFGFLYRMLWRLQQDRNLLKVASDPDVRRFEAMEKAVRRDSHKMHAFVRFRQVGEDRMPATLPSRTISSSSAMRSSSCAASPACIGRS
ncbi:DUF4130 domain-containing protein [Mesorhizobium sp. IMUNJ 23232]|uniref:DUF4130 domain-containing protein n=1 Tax=Mesorhizobium sp. IMUNJ 23232 TaxID=3376064 RepID=UPI0037A8A4A4